MSEKNDKPKICMFDGIELDAKMFKTQLGDFKVADQGEFGGYIEFPNGELNTGNFIDVFDCGNVVYALDCLSHLTCGESIIYRINHEFKMEIVYPQIEMDTGSELLGEKENQNKFDMQQHDSFEVKKNIHFKCVLKKPSVAYCLFEEDQYLIHKRSLVLVELRDCGIKIMNYKVLEKEVYEIRLKQDRLYLIGKTKKGTLNQILALIDLVTYEMKEIN